LTIEAWPTSRQRFSRRIVGTPPGCGAASDSTVLLNPLTVSLHDERLYNSIN